jgi:flagellar M-ring protein FliF
MAAVEADVLRGRLGTEDPADGVMVTTSRGSMVNADRAQAPLPAPGPVRALLQRPMVRQTLPYVGIALVLLLAVMAYISMSTPAPRALYPEMADADKEAAQQLLQKNGVTVRLDSTTGSLTVPADQFHEARIMLAAAGLPKESSGGSSVLKETMPLGTSQFMEQARYNATVEEELAQSIRRINTIQNARVHLALPRQSAFISDRVDPKASVIVTPYAGRALSEGQVQAIVHLVSSSIPYMTPAGVSVVDQFGRLLTEAQGAKDLNAKQLELRQKVEADYVDRINQILAPIFGSTNVHAQVSADLDFSVIEQTMENFDPGNAGTKVRSEQLKQSEKTEPRATGVPGSLSNEPPAAAAPTADANLPNPAAGQAAADNTIRGKDSSQSRNYEMDRTVKYVVDPAPRMRRLTVGVAINDAIAAAGAATAPTRRPLPEAEIARLTSLVQGAVGFSADRGDLVNIISTSFEPPHVEAPVPLWQQSRYIDLAKYVSVALAIALLALLVVRPVVNRLTYVPQPEMSRDQMLASLAESGVNVGQLTGAAAGASGEAGDGEGGAQDGAAGDKPSEGDVELREGETLEELRARLKPRKKTAISAEMLDTANSYDDKVTVVRMMVSQDAKRVALVLKNLIAKDIR